MALRLHLRRALSLSTALLSHTRLTPTPTTTIPAATSALTRSHFLPRSFSSAPRSFNDDDKMNPEILFEGCDYNHWLIVMDFGKDPDQHPSPDQMVETYVQTCAKVVGSIEEAKKKIYACSTTTYTGFQVEVDEETSKKFEGLPGVIFVLPDSYIDPVNKEYGGDKYINGEIIHRPPPVQYGRTGRGFRPNNQRFRDPIPNQQGSPGYNQHAPMPQDRRGFTPQGHQQGHQQGFPNQQGNPAFNRHESMPQDRRGYAPQGPRQGFPQQQSFPSQQNYPPQQNYGPSGQVDSGASMPGATHNPAVGRDGYQGGQRYYVPPQQGNLNPDYNLRQGQMSNPPGTHGGYAQLGQYQGDAGDHGYIHPQGQRGNHPGEHGSYARPGQMEFSGGNRSNSPSHIAGAYGQAGAGPFEQSGTEQFGQGPTSGSYGHGAGYTPRAENQRFPPTSNEQRNPMEHGNYPPGTQTGFNQRRY